MPRLSFWTPLQLYLLGIGLGLIPLAVWLVGWSASACSLYGGVYWPTSGLVGGLETAAMYLYLLQLVAGLVCRGSRRTRHIGNGLLTLVLVDPVVGAIWMQRHRQPATVTALRMRRGGSNVRLEIARAHRGCRGG
jgi:hypothetical protein